MSVKNIEWVETETSRICLKNGIIRTQSRNTVHVSLEVGKENFIVIQKLFRGVHYPILMDASNRKQSISLAYLQFLSEVSHEYFSAAAIVVGSPTSKFIARFFVRLFARKLQIPIKFTTSREEGLEWLQQFKAKNIT